MTYEYEILACVVPGYLLSLSKELDKIGTVKANPLGSWIRIGYIRAKKELNEEDTEKVMDAFRGKSKHLQQWAHGSIRKFELRQLKKEVKK
ncbi:hypothetical protein KAT51_08110 [bacterium]|nr:hypothetical protein [bacterium]